MKNYDYWKSFIKTGRIDDYLHYIACTQESEIEEYLPGVDSASGMERNKEGGFIAGINYRDGDGSISHAGW